MKFLAQFTGNHIGAPRLPLIGVPGLSLAAIPASFADDSGTAGPGFLPSPIQAVSTVPPNGDVNPYGVAFVPNGFPGNRLNPRDILVSNFNNNANLKGTGTTIIRIQPDGQRPPFFQGNAQQKVLSRALDILHSGFVLVGSFPSTDGTCATTMPGSLLVLDRNGNVVQTITSYGINGPWDMTLPISKDVIAFVANGLSGTIVRLDMELTPTGFAVQHSVEIARLRHLRRLSDRPGLRAGLRRAHGLVDGGQCDFSRSRMWPRPRTLKEPARSSTRTRFTCMARGRWPQRPTTIC